MGCSGADRESLLAHDAHVEQQVGKRQVGQNLPREAERAKVFALSLVEVGDPVDTVG
jgi:hypothetical protein